MSFKFFKQGSAPDYVIILATFLLVVFGLIMVASASSELARKNFGDSYFYFKHQLIYGFSLGLIGFFLASKIYYKTYQKWAVFLFILSLVGLILIYTPLGVSAGGADRWIKVGPLIFQPAEVMKIAFFFFFFSFLFFL